MIHSLLSVVALVCVAPAMRADDAQPRIVLAGPMVVSMQDGRDGTAAPRTIIVQGDRIAAVIDPAAYRFQLGDTLIRAEGRWLIPGLTLAPVDHADPAALRLLALGGITGVGISDESALRALAPLAARPGARLPTLVQAPFAVDTRLDPISLANVDAPVDRVLRSMQAAVDRGDAPASVLRQFTRDASLAVNRTEAGVIEVGAVADLVLLEGDPRENLMVLREPRAVILRGQLVTRAEMESTKELIAELAESSAAAFNDVPPPPAWPDVVWSRRFLVRFDGLPHGATRCQVRSDGAGWESHVQGVLWSPLHSVTTIAARHDRRGRVVWAAVHHRSPAGAFDAMLERVDEAWRIEFRSEEGEQSLVDFGDPARPSPETVVLDLLPTPPDLRRIALRLDEPTIFGAAELAYGAGPTTWTPMVLGSVGAHASPGRDPIERAVEPLLPPGGLIATIWTALDGNPFRMLANDRTRRSALGVNRTTIGFDESGWPVAAMIAVPEGLWQVHPWDAPFAVPNGRPRGNDVVPP